MRRAAVGPPVRLAELGDGELPVGWSQVDDEMRRHPRYQWFRSADLFERWGEAVRGEAVRGAARAQEQVVAAEAVGGGLGGAKL